MIDSGDLSLPAIRDMIDRSSAVPPTITDLIVPDDWEHDGMVFGFRVIETEKLPITDECTEP